MTLCIYIVLFFPRAFKFIISFHSFNIFLKSEDPLPPCTVQVERPSSTPLDASLVSHRCGWTTQWSNGTVKLGCQQKDGILTSLLTLPLLSLSHLLSRLPQDVFLPLLSGTCPSVLTATTPRSCRDLSLYFNNGIIIQSTPTDYL